MFWRFKKWLGRSFAPVDLVADPGFPRGVRQLKAGGGHQSIV